MAEWIPPLQAVASCAWACGIAGALLPRLVPALVPATVYGRHFDDHSRTSSSPSSSAPSSGLPSSSSSSSSSATSFLAAAVSASRAWTVPKRFFTLFYLLGIAVAGAVLVVAWQGGYPAWSLVLLAAYTAHLLRRLLECIFVHRFSPDARMPVPLFLAGCAHYVLVPVSLLPACQGTLSSLLSLFGLPFLATLMGWGAGTTAANGPADGPQQPSSTVAGGPSSSSSPSTAVDALALVRAVSAISLGMMLFVVGNIAQHFIHRKLAGLRDEGGDGTGAGGGATTAGDAPSSPSAGRTQRRRRIGAEGAAADDDGGAAAPFMDVDLNGSSAPPSPARPRTAGASSSSSSGQATPSTLLYPPPRGGFFDYAVCPHYTAEIVIYVGLFVAQLGLGHVFGRLPPPPPCGAGGEQVASPFFLSLARLGPLLLVAWVVTNLGVTGARTRKWYVDKYPREYRIRYTAAVIPWVW